MTNSMATLSVRIPQAGQAMTEATIQEWFVGDGAVVAAGQPLYRLETDKVEMDIESPGTGTLVVIEREGTTHPVGAEIARIES